jgi:hypothetical protein
MCIEKVPRISVEFLTPATTDNVETGKNFKLWTELNFCGAWNFRREAALSQTRRAGPSLRKLA